MKHFDFSLYIISYNFVVAVLLIIASEKIGAFAGRFTGAYKEKISRAARVALQTFGSTVALLMLGVYLAAYIIQ
jgi:hypothetical protein